jgi:hypothetical protein
VAAPRQGEQGVPLALRFGPPRALCRPPSQRYSARYPCLPRFLTPQVTCARALQRYASMLTPEELSACQGSASPEAAKERILARAFVRSVLAQYASGGPLPEQLVFDRNRHGKPSLAWPGHTALGQRLQFNLTHTASLIGELAGHMFFARRRGGGAQPGIAASACRQRLGCGAACASAGRLASIAAKPCCCL